MTTTTTPSVVSTSASWVSVPRYKPLHEPIYSLFAPAADHELELLGFLLTSRTQCEEEESRAKAEGRVYFFGMCDIDLDLCRPLNISPYSTLQEIAQDCITCVEDWFAYHDWLGEIGD